MIQDYNTLIETTIEKNASGNKAFFIIKKELSLNNIEFLKSEMQNNIDNCKSFTIQLEAIDTIDIAAIQLLHSFISKIKELKKTISYEADLSESIKKLLLYSGLNDYTKNKTF